MPKIDVSGIILDADFCAQVVVTRRAEALNTYGESVLTSSDTSIYAVVQAGSQPELDRAPDGQAQPNKISVHTLFRLVGPAEGYQPDVVTWRGRKYVVMRTYDYSHYGRGFVSAECSSLDYLDSV